MSFNLQAESKSPVNASNNSEWSSNLSNTSTEMSTVIAPNNSDIGTASQSSWIANITQDTYLLVYAVSLAGIIILQLVKGFAGAKVLKEVYCIKCLQNIGIDMRKSIFS